MRQVRITVTPHAPLDVRGMGIAASAPTVGVAEVRSVHTSELYFVRGELSDTEINRLCEALLSDPAAHTVTWQDDTFDHAPGDSGAVHVVEVAYLPGVMDPLALQLARAAHEIG